MLGGDKTNHKYDKATPGPRPAARAQFERAVAPRDARALADEDRARARLLRTVGG
jgi:hypothetical protein